jgi:hypothetical protein
MPIKQKERSGGFLIVFAVLQTQQETRLIFPG